MPVGVAVIGCGQWGMNHVRNFMADANAEVIACCDATQERLQALEKQYPQIEYVTPDLEKVLSDQRIQACVVAVPSGVHETVVRACLENGKDVLCEKPLTLDSKSCEELALLADQQQRLLMVGHVFVFNAAVQRLKEDIDQGSLGNLHYLSARRTNLGPVRNDVDALWDLAPHDISIFDYLMNGRMPQHVSAYGGKFLNQDRSDVVFVTLAYPNNVVANIQVSWLDPQKRREITVVGSQQMAIFNDMSFDAPLWIYDKGMQVSQEPYESFEKFRVLSWDRDARVPKIPPQEPLKRETAHFLECVTTRQKPLTDGANALRVIRILEAITESMQQNGKPIDCEDLRSCP